jgi:hypothetical protein
VVRPVTVMRMPRWKLPETGCGGHARNKRYNPQPFVVVAGLGSQKFAAGPEALGTGGTTLESSGEGS